MNRREKKQISKELAAIASLRDSDIDTSDIPEITDWSRAVVGRFYLPQEPSPTQPASSSRAFASRQLPDPGFDTQLSPGIAVAEMTPQQLVSECVEGHADAWKEFIRRFGKLVMGVAVRAASRWGDTSPGVVEDLIQDVYLKLGANDSELLRKFHSRDENALFAYLKVVTANVVNDHFRAIRTLERGGASGSNSIELNSDILRESSDAGATAERATLLEEIDRALKAVASERDRTIFRLFYRNGLSPKAIASIPEFGLTIKGVESAILRITRLVRSKLAQSPPTHQSQTGTLALPLTDRPPRARSPKKKD